MGASGSFKWCYIHEVGLSYSKGGHQQKKVLLRGHEPEWSDGVTQKDVGISLKSKC